MYHEGNDIVSTGDKSWIQYSSKPSFKGLIIKRIVKLVCSFISKSDLYTLRRKWDSISKFSRIPGNIKISSTNMDGVACEWITPDNAKADRVIIYLHGGGYVLGSLDTARTLALLTARYTGERVLSAGYRLAPENPFPAALDDSLAVYNCLLERGISSSNIVLIGDSAGGGLCLAAVLALKDMGKSLPGGIICLSPWTDLAATGESMKSNLNIDPMFGKGSGAMKAAAYAGEEDFKTPYVSPLYGDYNGFPPVLIHVGSDEILLDDSIRLAEKARESEVNVTLKVWKGMWHVFSSIGGILPESRKSLREISDFIRRVRP